MSLFVSQAAKSSLALAVAVCLSAGTSRAAERASVVTHDAARSSSVAVPATFHTEPTNLQLNEVTVRI